MRAAAEPNIMPACFPNLHRNFAAQRYREQVQSAMTIVANDTGQADVDLWAWFNRQATTTIKNKAKQRLTILQAVEALQDAGMTKTAAIQSIAREHGVSPSAIGDWFTLVSGVATLQLAPAPCAAIQGRRQNRDRRRAWKIMKSDYLRPERPAFAACYNRLLEDHARPNGITLPSMKTLKRRMDREIANAQETQARGPRSLAPHCAAAASHGRGPACDAGGECRWPQV
jgi:hypothetical protein